MPRERSASNPKKKAGAPAPKKRDAERDYSHRSLMEKLGVRDGQTIAIRASDGRLHFFRHVADEYSASEWLKRDGDTRVARDAIATRKDGVLCDAFGCVARMASGFTIAVLARMDALHEDCANADVVIGSFPLHGQCRRPKLVIDKFDVIRNGAYTVWLGDKITSETVQQIRGDRPWSRAPWQRKEIGRAHV